MKLQTTDIPDVVMLTPDVYGDDRGFFMETWRDSYFKTQVADVTFVQDNHSRSKKGVLRGLHYQIQHPQGKLVRVTCGEVFDVAVDIRRHSKHFGRWVGGVLSEKNKKMFWVPPGFAHGFYVMSETAEFIYKCTDYYFPAFERSILWNDPGINIQWPVQDGQKIHLSAKDEKGVLLENAEIFS
jgi:dTDP-4-dehydrorhamnose 3,5-epimerase